MNPDTNNTPKPDYSFITDQPSINQKQSKSPANNKKLIILVGAILVLVAVTVLSLTFGKVKTSNQSTDIARSHIQTNFLAPVAEGDYQRAAKTTVNGNEDYVQESVNNLEKTFTIYSAKGCTIESSEEKLPIVSVFVVCTGPDNSLAIKFDVLVGRTTQSIVAKEVSMR